MVIEVSSLDSQLTVIADHESEVKAPEDHRNRDCSPDGAGRSGDADENNGGEEHPKNKAHDRADGVVGVRSVRHS